MAGGICILQYNKLKKGVSEIMKKITAIFIAAMTIFSLAACGSTAPAETTAASAAETDGASASSELTGHIFWYTADPEDIAVEILDAFVAENPKVTYDYVRNGAGKLTAALTEEMEAGGTECNCFSLADLAFINSWDSEGRVHHFRPEGYEKLISDPFGDTGFFYKAEVNVIAYNTTQVKEAPKDWKDLLDPSLKGMVAFPDPSYSGGALMSAVVFNENADITGGWDFYKALKDNDLKFEQANGGLKTKVASGEYAAVCMVDFMARAAKAEGAPVEVVYPESGSILVHTPFVALSSMKEEDKAAVEAFGSFLLSPKAQEIFTKNGYLPVVTGVEAPEGIDITKLKFLDFELQYYIDNVDDIREKYAEIFPAN